MTKNTADNFFNDIDFVSIVSTVKGIMTSDGAMSVLLDFERCLDDCDLYAFKNWETGELVQGPDIRRYSVNCTFMWPSKLMPDPRGAKRLTTLGCKVKFYKTSIKVPVVVKNYDDFVQGTMYPKMIKRKVWLVNIEIPLHLMDTIKKGSIELEDQTIDLREIDDAYDEDLDAESSKTSDTGAKPMVPPVGPV